MKKYLLTIICASLFISTAVFAQTQTLSQQFAPATDSLQNYLSQYASAGYIRIDTLLIRKKTMTLRFKTGLSEYPLREKQIEDIYAIVRHFMPEQYLKYSGKLKIYTNGQPLEDLKSNYYTSDRNNDFVKEHKKFNGKYHKKLSAPLVTNKSKSNRIESGLQNRHIAIWQSHGYYYEPKLKRWEWQRARIFETVEDLYTQSYVLPFLVPMLENAGANVLLPRERDWQSHEVVVDNDTPDSGYSEIGKWNAAPDSGFANTKDFYLYKENPFKMGTARSASGNASASWIPDIPQAGEYAVYVSYQTVKNGNPKARYEVRYSGGITTFSVNQTMGGGTWIYLGRFYFEKGKNNNHGVFLNTYNESNKIVTTADAVKFGGGMGNIARKPAEVDPEGKPIETDFTVSPEISGYPRFTEGARYWLQWAGFNDTIYSINRDMTDYNDDYQSRGQWVNTLSDGSYLKPGRKGYNIPLDLSFAFHTDAGTTLNDSIIGSLAIYTRLSNSSDKYPNGEKRIIARDLTDIVQTQIVSDIRANFEPIWSRRGLWDRSYSESRSPEVPAMLLELLSHQNFADMRYGLDPSFRFCVSRAIYKGMLKYIAYINDFEYTVQPLPINTFSAEIDTDANGGHCVNLNWLPTKDSTESTAYPDGYIVYTRVDKGGFDNGFLVRGENARMAVEPGKIYSFMITAVNAGGESFPSEILSVGLTDTPDQSRTVLVVNNFDRISAPSSFATRDSSRAGFQDAIDAGVPYLRDISYIGAQHEFRREIPWMDDDAPGFGASWADYETTVVAGNTFDYPYIHGIALMKAGYSFVSTSRDAITSSRINMDNYPVVDIICGKQVTTMIGRKGAGNLKYRVFPLDFQHKIESYALSGGNLLISGANIASDIWDKIYDFDIDSTMNADIIVPSMSFASNILKYRWMTNYASKTGEIKAVQNPLGIPASSTVNVNELYRFNTKPNTERYAVETPDALVPTDPKAYTVYRYNDNNISAGVVYDGDVYKAVSLGFPIEALESQAQIDKIIYDILNFFQKK
ncbi:MAG: xanthan lyase [Bacteroidales bacterium]|nr:xanthan lyase [Bacteroidales bacterium]MDD4670930.1 xanthan lyase [Bacteroidales bacterium]